MSKCVGEVATISLLEFVNAVDYVVPLCLVPSSPVSISLSLVTYGSSLVSATAVVGTVFFKLRKVCYSLVEVFDD